MKKVRYPSLYQINTRVWITELSGQLGRQATLDDIPENELDRLAEMGFDWIWLLSVWTTGEPGRKISRENPVWQHEFAETLPDLKEEDIGGSGFAIVDYQVHPQLGGDEALKRLREKLRKRGLKLMLDFVPNHIGPGHTWVEEHPDYLVSGSESDLENFPQNYTLVKRKEGEMIFAYGRDPYFSGWPDSLQLDYSNPATAEVMTRELVQISGKCDGVRCDMAMLVLPEVFEKTWGRKSHPLWSLAIKAVRKTSPDFCFMAEVYWDMEWILQQQGFDYTYDKRLYDRLYEGDTRAVHEHFYASLDYQDKLARFLENHDEQRAASAFETNMHKAAAVITYLSPGLRFFHQGQFEGRKKRISPHLVRAPQEAPDSEIQKFYLELLTIIRKPVFRDGQWQLLNCVPSWDGNDSWNSFLAFAWEGKDNERVVISINYAPHDSQCFVRLPFNDLSGLSVRFRDMMSSALYDRDGDDLLSRGLFLDMPAWSYHVFEVSHTG
ncbi:alpha-amylase family glycosyl hydrolase [Flavihumibacter solisilvae]|uniref:Alpha-amylase n=1 Tax=Flavihumibacter solisilvae TaxID=1349421 RepID=A0A0C1L2I0_9BACT|nr:alpha-amylase family glycosyl hydrolase [Flavihumibacter solisilvae]KIC93811.1 alpha-amylase [Flavihumibacter solisilvae]